MDNGYVHTIEKIKKFNPHLVQAAMHENILFIIFLIYSLNNNNNNNNMPLVGFRNFDCLLLKSVHIGC